MSGVGVILRERRRANVRRPGSRRTREQYATTMRAAALSLLALPNLTEDAAESAHQLLEMVGDTLILPRHGWYPKAPKGWRS